MSLLQKKSNMKSSSGPERYVDRHIYSKIVGHKNLVPADFQYNQNYLFNIFKIPIQKNLKLN